MNPSDEKLSSSYQYYHLVVSWLVVFNNLRRRKVSLECSYFVADNKRVRIRNNVSNLASHQSIFRPGHKIYILLSIILQVISIMMKRNRDLAAVYLEGLALLLLGLALLGGSRFMSSAASSSSSAASLSTSSSCLNDGTMMDTSTTASNECLVSNDVASASSILAQSLTGGASEDDGNSGGVSSSEASFTSPAPKTTAGLGADMGEPQLLDSTYSNEIMDRIDEARRYLQKTVMVDDEKKYAKTKDICVNKHQSCAFCGVLGECEKNPGYMKVNCAPVCKSCEMLHVETRCPMDPEATDALYPGDLDAMFERISTAEEFQQYEPTVVSRPPEGPWMIIFDNAISDEEADALIRLGGELGYERSADVGEEKADGTYTKKINNRRTSTNAWCVDDCYSDPIA